MAAGVRNGRPSRAPLCPGMARFVDEVGRIYENLGGDEPIAAQRVHYDDVYSAAFRRPRPDGVSAEDRTIAGVPVRVYRPPADPVSATILYMHGGGWVLGSIESHDCVTAEIAAATRTPVVSIGYRLAPEHPFPAGFEDCRAVLRTVMAGQTGLGLPLDRIVVAGDSAGGNLAAALSLAARDEDGATLAGQALMYPVLSSGFEMPSHFENADAPMLQTHEMRKFWRLYLGGADVASHPHAAPLLARAFDRLPPAFIAVAGHDPARDDGEAYAAALRGASVPVDLRCADDLAHGHLRARAMSPSAGEAYGEFLSALTRMTRD